MAFGGLLTKSSDFGRTIEKLKTIFADDDPEELLILAAGQHCLDVKFNDLLGDHEHHTFICSVQVGNLLGQQECIGYGPTKKDAKMNAAREAILEITQRLNDLSPSTSSYEPSNASKTTSQAQTGAKSNVLRTETASPVLNQASIRNFSNQDFSSRWFEDLMGRSPSPSLTARGPSARRSSPLSYGDGHHPISALKEMADTHHWPQPKYKELDEYGEDHMKMFVIQCMFRDMLTEGVASTKKAAKKKSAEEMLTKIGRNGNIRPEESSSSSRVHSASLPKANGITSARLLQKDVPVKRSDHYKNKLKKLASDRGWTIEWHDLEEGFKGNALCFVRIKTTPVTVCSGSGITTSLAYDDAAMNALKILNLMQ